jgi:hypothetical protein
MRSGVDRAQTTPAQGGLVRFIRSRPKEVVVLTTRPVVACVMACALLASAVAAPAVIAAPTDQERYLQSYGAPQVTDDGVAAAEATESYYSSYGPPQDTASGGADWLQTALLSVALALAAIAVIVALRRRRFHTGRRRAARIAV